MRTKSLIVLVALAVVAAAAALFAVRMNREATAPGATTEKLLPALGAHVNDVASVTVQRDKTAFTVARKDGQWRMTDKGGYPVQFEKVKELVVGLADLTQVEPKTSKPDLYPRIGVQDPTPPAAPPTASSNGAAPPAPPTPPTPNPDEPITAKSTLVTLKDQSGQTLASLIVGATKPGSPPMVYVRKPGEAQSWLAQGKLDVQQGEAISWLDQQIVNIPRERIQSVTVTHPDGQKVEVFRDKPEDANFTVKDIPAGRELNGPNAPDSLVSAISYMNLDDVAPAAQVDFNAPPPAPPPAPLPTEAGPSAAPAAPAPPASPAAPQIKPGVMCEYRTFDGLVIGVQTAEKDGKAWAKFSASYAEPPPPPTAPAAPLVPIVPDAASAPPAATAAPKGGKPADEVKKEAADLTAKVGGWAFEIPDYKSKILATKIDSLLKPLPPPPAPTAAPTPAPAPAPPNPAPTTPPPPPPSTPPDQPSSPPPDARR